MANFDSGVASYITATGKVSNHFPVDNKGNAFVCCTYVITSYSIHYTKLYEFTLLHI